MVPYTVAEVADASALHVCDNSDIVSSPSFVKQEIVLNAQKAAKAAAYAAGEVLRTKRGQVEILQRKKRLDTLLNVDIEAEYIIVSKLHDAFPDFAFLSEEIGSINKDSEYCWLIDPLDGSFNFQHGYPIYGISISLYHRKETVMSVVYLPLYEEMFSVIQGCDVQLNDRHVHVSTVTNLDDASIHIGDFAKDGDREENQRRLAHFTRLANAVGRIRMLGTAATDFAYIACGRADAFIMHNAQPWDIEAGRLLIEQAGGKVTAHTREDGKQFLLCSNGHIHQQLLDVLL